MSNTKIEDSIISAVEILADRAIAKAGFDKTIQATIKRCENKAAGQYVVKYQDSSFYAYAASPDAKYSNNTLVYVLVPGGDFKKDKTILGAVKKLGNDYITMLGDDAYDIIGRNICTLSHAEFCSYEAEPCEHLLTMVNKDESYRYIKDASHLQIKASVWNSLDQNQIDKAGNYYLGIKIKFIDNAGADVIRDYRLGIPQMVGNPYTTVSPMKQSYIYEIDGEKIVEVIDIYVGKEGFDIDSTITDNDIFFSNIEVNAVEPLEFIGDGKLSLSIISKNGRTVTNTPGEKDIILEGCLKANGVVTTNKVEYLWFIEDCVTATGADYDSRAGKGWRKIEKGVGPTQNILTVPAGSIMAKEVRYRCLAIVDGSVLSKIVKLYNLNSDYDLTIESSGGNEFYYDQGEYTLTAKMTKGGNPYAPIAYYWMLMDNKGIYTILTDNGNGNLTDGGNPFKAQNIINFVKYYCVTVDSIGNILASASITITNKLEGGGYSLIIKNGIQLFKYNEKGLSPASRSNMNPIDIPALYYQIYSPEGELKVDSEVDNVSAINAYWMMPADTTMLTWEEGAKPPTEDGYYKIKQQKFAYGISNSFNASKNRNEIQLIVSYNGEVLTATTNFTFTKEGGNGTNGTVYALKIVRDSSNSNTLRYELYDDYGNFIPNPSAVVTNTKWSISGGVTGNQISVIDNSASATLNIQPLTTDKSADIIKLEAKNPDGYWVYAYYPVIRDNLVGMTYKLEGGAREVMFNSDCTVSSYDSTPYKVTLFDVANNDVTANYTINWRAESDVFTVNKDGKGFRVKGNYNASTTDAIWCEISNAAGLVGQIKIPILLIVNRYSNSALNGWDGVSIELDSTEGYFLAPQIGAGQKENDNSFTGVVMGTQQKTSSNAQDVGLFGYDHGKRTFFLNSKTGHLFAKSADIEGNITASSGKIGAWNITDSKFLQSENNQIWLHPEGYSATVNNNTKNFVFYANGNFGVDTSGDVYFNAGKAGPWTINTDGLEGSTKGYDNLTETSYVRPAKIGVSYYTSRTCSFLYIEGKTATFLAGGGQFLATSNAISTAENGSKTWGDKWTEVAPGYISIYGPYKNQWGNTQYDTWTITNIFDLARQLLSLTGDQLNGYGWPYRPGDADGAISNSGRVFWSGKRIHDHIEDCFKAHGL